MPLLTLGSDGQLCALLRHDRRRVVLLDDRPEYFEAAVYSRGQHLELRVQLAVEVVHQLDVLGQEVEVRDLERIRRILVALLSDPLELPCGDPPLTQVDLLEEGRTPYSFREAIQMDVELPHPLHESAMRHIFG